MSNPYGVMKNICIGSLVILIISALFTCCDREEKTFPPGVITASVDEITGTSAKVGGKVSENGGAIISDRGVYWGTSQKPETSGTKLLSGSGDGTFYEVISGLSPGVKYYVTAYAVNPVGTAYGEETFFTTQISMPVVTTSAVTELTSVSARAGGNVIDDGGFEITKRGIFWGTEPEPGLTGTKLEIGSGMGEFSATLTELIRGYTYYVTAFATNIKGTSYGSEISFSTEPYLPTVVTSSPLNITTNSVTIGGNISSGGGTDVTQRGIYWGRNADPVTTGMKLMLGTGTGRFETIIDTLSPAVTYYINAYAINNTGTAFGGEKIFLTKGKIPKIDKTFHTDLTRSEVTLNIQIDTTDLDTSITIEYGETSSYGSTTGSVLIPATIGDTVIKVTIGGLKSLTDYHYRVKAENDLGSVNSNDMQFRTVITGFTSTVNDYENNSYNTVGIGYHIWMAENLRSVRYNNGSLIPLVRKDSLWGTLATPAYCWYENDSVSNHITYGALYNWFSVETGNLCPVDWHVATLDDVTELINYVGGAGKAGKMLKEPGTTHWERPNIDSTNVYGFTARGGGKRSDTGVDDFLKVEGNWWILEKYSTLNAYYFNILFNYSNAFQAYFNKKTGMSVRCVKN